MQTEPRAPNREVMQCLRLILESGQKFMDLIHEDEPGFIMLRTLGRQSIPSLLSEGLLTHVFRDFHTLNFHTDIVHERRVAAKDPRKVFLHVAHTLTDNDTEPVA